MEQCQRDKQVSERANREHLLKTSETFSIPERALTVPPRWISKLLRNYLTMSHIPHLTCDSFGYGCLVLGSTDVHRGNEVLITRSCVSGPKTGMCRPD